MNYIKYFILYSFIGFIFESYIFKITKQIKHSGVLNGPYTLVYGLGGTFSFYLSTLISNPFLLYILLTLSCTLIELTTGYLIKYIYQFDSWDYSYKKLHLGKYICLDYALFWGLLSLLFVVYLNSFFTLILNSISNIFFHVIFIIIIIDIIVTYFQNKK